MIITVLRAIIFAVSWIGYILYIQRKTKLQVEFLPIISIALITFFLYFGGLFNVLPLIVSLLIGYGLLSFVLESYKLYNKNVLLEKIREFITPGIAVFLIMAIYFAIMLKNQRLVYRDDFSHWGLIVKTLLLENKLPNFEISAITHNGYPPGAALFIYYFCKTVGATEGFALIGQMIIMLSALLPIFSFTSFSLNNIKKNDGIKVLLIILTILLSLYLLSGPYSIHSLLVDNLLVVVSVSLFALIYYYLDNPEMIYIPVFLLASFITLIKNIGIFFAMFTLFVYFMSINNERKRMKQTWLIFMREKYYLILPIFSPSLINYLWSKHVDIVFSPNATGKHKMSLQSYVDNFNGKNIDEINEITGNFINTLFKEHAYQIIILLILVLVVILAYYLINKVVNKRLITLSIVVFAIFSFYSIGLWLTYLLSMSTEEGLRLASYNRYMDTIMDYLIGLVGIVIIHLFNNSRSKIVYLLATSIFLIFFSYLNFNEKDVDDTKAIFEPRDIPVGIAGPNISNVDKSFTHISLNPMKSISSSSQHLIYYPDPHGLDFETVFSKYRLYRNDMDIIQTLETKDIIWNYEIISVTFITDDIIELFEEYSDLKVEIGTFRINKENKRIVKRINFSNESI